MIQNEDKQKAEKKTKQKQKKKPNKRTLFTYSLAHHAFYQKTKKKW